MNQDQKLIMLFIYYAIFMFSFYGAFQTRSVILGKDEGDYVIKILWKEIHLETIESITKMRYVFYSLSFLTLVASVFMIYWTINYNYEVIKDKPDKYKEEIKKIWNN